MKKLTLLAVLLTVFSAATFATEKNIGETSKFKIIEKSDAKFDFYYVAETEGNVSVTIYDTKGNTVAANTVKNAKSFRRTYDFSKLTPGNYKVVVKNDDGIADQVIGYKMKAALLSSFVAKLPDSKSVKLHVGGFDHDTPVMVKIYNQDNQLIHAESINQEASFSRIYNLNKSLANSVNVVVENNGETQRFFYALN